MPVVSANGIEQYYEIVGDGPPLVLVAGMGGTANYWQDTATFFAEHYTVLTYDQRGTGRSQLLPVTSIEQLRDDLLALLDALDFDVIDFLGHSTGGNVAQIFAIENADRLAKLVIYASTSHGDAYRTKVWQVRRAILEKLGPELYGDMSSIMLYPPRWIVENLEKLESQQVGQMSMLATPEVQTSRIEAVQAFDRRNQLSGITSPTLVICARDDNQTPAYFSEYLAANIPLAKLILMDYGAHACSRTVPDEFNQHVLEFLWNK